ncbi:MAG: hypothetical protein CSA11_06245 [Chloroflexi bacterium]|nr:MAG: hypothetical protein CSA11_06245 [Chloroflexota bacterium]
MSSTYSADAFLDDDGFDLYYYADCELEARDFEISSQMLLPQYQDEATVFYPQADNGISVDLSSVVGMMLLAIVAIAIILQGVGQVSTAAPVKNENADRSSDEIDQNPQPHLMEDPLFFSKVYDEYVITQGPHGMEYGHYAIDLTGGRGANIYSPITGVVVELYVDYLNNTTLVIENEIYVVTFMHGDYEVTLGQNVLAGDVLGYESNHGYTMDMAGTLCYENPGCGNHTHLNVFDKRIQANVNPLDLLRHGE